MSLGQQKSSPDHIEFRAKRRLKNSEASDHA
jgi:hypothetical protein